jgi:TetR/AcrR family transcriptional regulator, repressor for uid operon
MDAQLVELVGLAGAASNVDDEADRTSRRILDAALHQAATVGLQRLTVEDVVRRAGVSRMTAYRRYPRRDDPRDGVAEAFIAAVRFAREHPLLRRAGHTEPPSVSDSAELLSMGSAFIANYIRGETDGTPSQQVRWVADVFARLFFTYISTPPTDPDFGDDAELRRFAHDILTPMVERVI